MYIAKITHITHQKYMLLTITEIRDEATNFRKLFKICDKKKTNLIIDCFPVMSCKPSSMLLSLNLKPAS